MAKSRDLDDAVQEVIKAGQIGQPVFVRCLIGVPDDREEQLKLLVDSVMTIQGWVGQPIERLYAVGALGSSLSLHVAFRNGASSLISGQSTGRWIADLIILGNHGALYRDAFWGGFALLHRSFPDTEMKRSIRRALELALATGKPQPVA
jgi:hypothetical protein